MAKFIVCEVAPLRGNCLKMEDMRIVALNVDCIDAVHQDIFMVKNGCDILEERIGLEVFPSKLKGDLEGRPIIMMDYCKFLKEVNNENI